MVEKGFRDESKWAHDSDNFPRVKHISDEADLEKLKLFNDDRDVIVIQGQTMPERKASEIARYIRQDCHSNAPFVYFSVEPVLASEKADFYDAGGDAFKEGEDMHMLPRILKSLQRRQRLVFESKKQFSPFEGLTIDVQKAKAFVQNRPVSLTGEEFKMLLLLAHKGQNGATQKELADVRRSEVVSSNTIAVTVSKIREKIRPFFINSDRETGYVLSKVQTSLNRVKKRFRGVDKEGNTLIALNATDKLLLDMLEKKMTYRQISKAFEEQGHIRGADDWGQHATRIFGKETTISSKRLIPPTTPDGDWIYKRPR